MGNETRPPPLFNLWSVGNAAQFLGAGEGTRYELPPNSALHIAAFINKPKDV